MRCPRGGTYHRARLQLHRHVGLSNVASTAVVTRVALVFVCAVCGALLAPTPQLLSTSLCHKIFQTIVQNILYFNGNR